MIKYLRILKSHKLCRILGISAFVSIPFDSRERHCCLNTLKNCSSVAVSNSHIDFPNFLLRALQWQLDASTSLVHQLLREYEIVLQDAMHLSIQHSELLEYYTPEGNPDLEDRLVTIRSEWTDTIQRLDKLELAVDSALGTLRSSIETCFSCEAVVESNRQVFPDSAPCTLSGQGSTMLHSAESLLSEMRETRQSIVNRWTASVEEHIKNWKET